MTVTVELSPDQEARLCSEAARRGIQATELARQLISQNLPAGSPTHDEDRVARIKQLRGKYKHVGVSTVDLAAERERDRDCEDLQVRGDRP